MKIYRHHTVEEKPAGSVVPCKHPDEIQYAPTWNELVAQNGETEVRDITAGCDRKPTYGLGVMQMLDDPNPDADLAQSARQRMDIDEGIQDVLTDPPDWGVTDWVTNPDYWKARVLGYAPLPPRPQSIIQVGGPFVERESIDDLTLKYKYPSAADLYRALRAPSPRIDYTKMPKLWTPK